LPARTGDGKDGLRPGARPILRPGSIVLLLCLVACARPAPVPVAPAPAGERPQVALRPAQAVQLLTRHLRDNDLAGFARDAVPPSLQAPLDAAWRSGRTRWPLDELPFARRLPALLQALAAPGSEARLQQGFDRQFSGATAQLHGAAVSLGLFGAQYIQHQGHFSDDERQHYAQLIQAASGWGARAPLGDRGRARAAIAALVPAARRTGLASAADFQRHGMTDGLQRMGVFAAAFKQALLPYGLDLDPSLDGMHATLAQQTGDSARVRMQYTFAGQDIDAVVAVERIDGRWYVSDFLHHAQAAVAASGSSAAH
jgi:hypothetical protein